MEEASKSRNGNLLRVNGQPVNCSHAAIKAFKGWQPSLLGVSRVGAGDFSILKHAGTGSSLAYSEGLFGAIFLDHGRDVERFQQVFEAMQATALTEEETMRIVAVTSAELKSRL